MNFENEGVWKPQHVVDVRDAAFAARTYYEHRDLRTILSSCLEKASIQSACELGAGFGRITPVLSEFCKQVTGFEREPAFVTEAQLLYPDILFVRVNSLDRLPAADHSFDLVVTFTVLQHLRDSFCDSVSLEINRITKPGALLIICEETDPLLRIGDMNDTKGICTIGRSVKAYCRLFSEFELLGTRSRLVEPTYSRVDVGTYLCFRKKVPALDVGQKNLNDMLPVE